MPRPLTVPPRHVATSPIFPRLILVAALIFLPGCLQRRIKVLTDPPGATVWLNDAEIGRSPADTNFTFFGTYDVRITKEGYQTLNTTRKTVAPWYEYPFIDLLVIALPWTVETKLEWQFELEPLKLDDPPARTELLERANTLRRELGAQTPPPEEPKDPAAD